MNVENYRKARSYSFKLDSELYRDILHDAYLAWWNKCERDLFDEHIGTIIKTVKYTFFAHLKNNVWFYNKVNQGQRKFVEFDENIFYATTPEDEYIATELLGEYMELINSVPKDRAVFTGNEETTKEILTKRLNGYTNKEIAEEMGISKALITYYLNRTKLSEFETRNKKMINNPFNGSKTKVKKRLTEKQWEERTDKDEFELESENEWDRLYVHKESKEGWIIKIKNPVQSEFYIKRLVDSKK